MIRNVPASGKREAKALLIALGAEVQNGLVTSADPTFSDLLDRWIAHMAGRGRSDATLYNYQRYIDRELTERSSPSSARRICPSSTRLIWTASMDAC